LAVLEYDCCNYSGSFFYPQEDGRRYWGRRFVFAPLASNGNQQIVYARDPAIVRVFDSNGTQVSVSPTLAAGTRWQINNVVPHQTYAILSEPPANTTSPALIAVQSSAGNGNTQVPPVPRETDGLRNDCNNDRGTEFFFSTYAWRRGSIAVFNPNNTPITFSLQTVSAGALTNTNGYQNITVPANSTFINSSPRANLGTAQYRLVASGPITLWAGDQEVGDGIGDMGDDITNNFGDRGRSFLISSQTQGATIFALEANTQVTYAAGGTPTTVTLAADGFLSLPAGATYTVTASRPVSIQTAGANGLNDWAVQLRPAQARDTDGNGLDDADEGTSCRSIAPDTDRDGLFDFEDTDDDNDCLPDVNDVAGRTDASLPNAGVNANCSAAALQVCDQSATQAVCRECIVSADCASGTVCHPTNFNCIAPPTTLITVTPLPVSASPIASFQFQSPANPTATFECSIDSAPFQTCTSPFTSGALSDGSHTFSVRAIVDQIVDPMPASFTWSIDTIDPSAPTVAVPVNGSKTSNNRPIISGTSDPDTEVTVFIDGVATFNVSAPGPTGAFSVTPTIALADGPHVISAVARDAAGNASAMSSFNQITVDTTPPAAPILITPPNGSVVGIATPTITGTAEPGSVVNLRIDGLPAGSTTAGANGAFTFALTMDLTPGSHVVTAQATDSVGNVGADTMPGNTFTVDLTVLDTSLALTPPSLSNSAVALFVFSANKTGALFQCELDNAGFANCANPTTLTGLSDGPHTLAVRAVVGSEVDTTPASYAWTVDTSVPGAPFVTAPTAGQGLATARPTITGTGPAGDSVTIVIDGIRVGTALVNGMGLWSFVVSTGLSEGLHSVRATATDAAGNVSAPSMDVSFTVDTVAPLPPFITSPVAGTTLTRNTPTYSGTAEASSRVQVEVDGLIAGTVTTAANGTWSLNAPSPLTDAAHTVRARSTDAVGNVSGNSVTVPFNVDTTAPNIPIVRAPTANATLAVSRPVIEGSAAPASSVTIRVDGAVSGIVTAANVGTFTFTIASTLSDGPHRVTAQATDPAGNASSESAPVLFSIDTVAPPAPVISAPAAMATIGMTPITITGTAERSSIVTVIVDSIALAPVTADANGAWSVSSGPLAAGRHSLSATTRDAGGNISAAAAQILFTVDTTVLDTTILTGPKTTTNSTSAEFSFDSSKRPITYECNLDQAGFTACTNPVTFANLSAGAHQLAVRARFSSIEVDATPASWSWTVDLAAPPPAQVTVPASGELLSTAMASVSGTAEPNSTVVVLVDGSIIGSANANPSGIFSILVPTALGQGDHTVSAQSTDAAGNVGPLSPPTPFTIDSAPPAPPVLLGPSAHSLLANSRPVFTGTAEPGAEVTLIVNGQVLGVSLASVVGRFTFSPNSPLSDGQHTVAAQAKDVVGHVSQPSNPVTFATDTQAPGTPQVRFPADHSSSADTTPTLSGAAEPKSTVTVRCDEVTLGTTVTDALGAFAFTSPEPLREGVHLFTVTTSDAAGNVSRASAVLRLTIDTKAPAAPVIRTPAPRALVETATPRFEGQAEPNAVLRIRVDGLRLGETTANDSGDWSFLVLPGQALALGTHRVQAEALDAAGNRSLSLEVPFNVETPERLVPQAPLEGSARSEPETPSTRAPPTPVVGSLGCAQAGSETLWGLASVLAFALARRRARR
jgi:hypothetical protein